MTAQAASTSTLKQLFKVRDGLIIHQALCAAAKLGVADLLERGVHTTAELADELKVNEDALYRMPARECSRRPLYVRLEIQAFLALCGQMSLDQSGPLFFSGELISAIGLLERSFTACRQASQREPGYLAGANGNTCVKILSWLESLTMR